MVVVCVFALFHMGCGAGCSCAQKESASPNENPQTAKAPTAQPVSQRPSSPQKTAINLVDVGRDVEFGRYADALQKLKGHIEDSDKTRYLAARAMFAQKKFKSVVRVLAGPYAFSHSELQHKSLELRLDALIVLKRFSDAVKELNALLENPHLSKGEKRDLLVKRGECQMTNAQFGEALASFEHARKWAGPKLREKLAVQMGAALMGEKRRSEAVTLLAPLALSSGREDVMNDAYQLLVDNDSLPDWSAKEKLGRIRQLIANKSWSLALGDIAALEKDSGPDTQKELRWNRAQVQFKRRRHYKEAISALALVEKDGAPYADDAAFLKARALARLDRDEESIGAFRTYAKKTRNKARADEARFHAARLEFYLGKHAAALKNFKLLVGDTKHQRRTGLDGGTTRDAWFLMGMSAFLQKRYNEATKMFAASSVGSKSQEAILRNQYWAAAAQLFTDVKAGQTALEEVCQDDGTSWYAAFAAVRLQQAGLASEVCRVLLPAYSTAPSANHSDGAKPQKSAQSEDNGELIEPNMSLEQISSKAALYASMGLYRPAAEALQQVENGKKSPADRRDFIAHYLRLDAPQYAIRSASIGLEWNFDNSDFPWLAHTAYPVPYRSLVHEQEQRHNLPPYLIYAIARKESLFDPLAVSYVGAMGMMQMMPATYETNRKRAGLPRLVDGALPTAAQSVVAGGFELAHLLEKFNGSIPLAVMAYNGGSGAVERWLTRSGEFTMDVFVEKAGFAQTRNYVRRVYQNLIRYTQLYNAPLPSLPRFAQPKDK